MSTELQVKVMADEKCILAGTVRDIFMIWIRRLI